MSPNAQIPLRSRRLTRPLSRSLILTLTLTLTLTSRCPLALAATGTTLAGASGALVAVIDRLERGWLVLVTEEGSTLDVPCGDPCASARGERLKEGAWVIYWPDLALVEPLSSDGARRMSELIKRRAARLTEPD